MNILGLETSTEACSVALWSHGEITVREKVAPREHGKLVLPMVDSILADSGISRSALDAVAFGRGPGAFTGVRIAVSVAQGLAYGLDRPALPVSTLAALAKSDYDQHGYARILTAIDARMGEIYFAGWNCEDMSELVAESVLAPEDVAVPGDGPWQGTGSGFGAYEAALKAQLGERLAEVRRQTLPSARAVVQLGREAFDAGLAVGPQEALPVYLRDNVAHVKH